MVRYETQGAVAVITLDNGRLNILTREMHRELYHVFQRFLRDDSVKVAVLTNPPGTGFSAGDDLKALDRPYAENELPWETLVMQMQRMKPVIAAVRGHCVGQGMVYLLLHTDIRFATPDALFGFPEIRLGMGGAALITQLAQQVPQTVAMRMTLAGENMTAQQAAACYLINEVVEPNRLLEVAMAEAHKVAGHPLSALRCEMLASVRRRQLGQAETMALLEMIWDEQTKNRTS